MISPHVLENDFLVQLVCAARLRMATYLFWTRRVLWKPDSSLFFQATSPTKPCPLQAPCHGFRASSVTPTTPASVIPLRERVQELWGILMTQCEWNAFCMDEYSRVPFCSNHRHFGFESSFSFCIYSGKQVWNRKCTKLIPMLCFRLQNQSRNRHLFQEKKSSLSKSKWNKTALWNLLLDEFLLFFLNITRISRLLTDAKKILLYSQNDKSYEGYKGLLRALRKLQKNTARKNNPFNKTGILIQFSSLLANLSNKIK